MISGLARRLAAWPAYRWVCLMLAGYFVAALAGTWINFLDFHLNGIGYYDLSINQQALSSTIHSNQPYPFYEATDCGRTGRCSFLLVHPVFLAYLVAVPYALWPSAFTLFAIQDLALALAALPLFAIARLVTQSNRLSIVIAGIYLVWLPAFSGIFSFHWEAFIPLEFFLVFWLWLTHRYRWAIPVVLVGCITLEVMPVLLFFLAMYFLWPWLRPALSVVRTELRHLVMTSDPLVPRYRALGARIATVLRDQPRITASLFLLVGSALGYLLLHGFVSNGHYLGLPALPSRYLLPLTRPVYATLFTFHSLSTAWQSKLLFWLVIYGTLAAVPVLAPRTFVILFPWVVVSLFSTPGYYRMGDQYGFVIAALIFIGFIYGVARLKQWAETVPSAEEVGEGSSPPTDRLLQQTQKLLEDLQKLETASGISPDSGVSGGTVPPASSAATVAPADRPRSVSGPEIALWWRRRRRAARASLTIILVGVVAFNLFLNPLNPLAAQFKTDRPFVPQASLGLTGGLDTTDYNRVLKVVSLIPSDAIVGVSPVLFTFVTADPNAFPLQAGSNYANLPFYPRQPQYLLLLGAGGTSFPANTSLKSWLYDTNLTYGVRAFIPSTYLGGVLLFQKGFDGATEVLGTPPVFNGGTFTPGAGLNPGKAGALVSNNTSRSGTVIEARLVPGPDSTLVQATGRLSSGPGLTLPGGNYTVTVLLSGTETGTNPGIDRNPPVATIIVGGFQVTFNNTPCNLSTLAGGNWTVFTFHVSFAYPVLDFFVTVNNRHDWYRTQVNYVTITPILGT